MFLDILVSKPKLSLIISILNFLISGFNLCAMGNGFPASLQSLAAQKVMGYVLKNTYNCDEIHEAYDKVSSTKAEHSWRHNYNKLGHLHQDLDPVLNQAAKDFILKNYNNKNFQKNLWLNLQSKVLSSYCECNFNDTPETTIFSKDSQILLVESEANKIYQFNFNANSI